MIHVLIHRLLTMEGGARFLFNPLGIRGGLITRDRFFSYYFDFPLKASLHCSTPITSSTVDGI